MFIIGTRQQGEGRTAQKKTKDVLAKGCDGLARGTTCAETPGVIKLSAARDRKSNEETGASDGRARTGTVLWKTKSRQQNAH